MKCAKISLICLTDDIYSIGPRRISSQLKRNGFKVQLIFLQAKSFWGQIKERFGSHHDENDLSERTCQELISLCADSRVEGISVWTHNADRGSCPAGGRVRRELSFAGLADNGSVNVRCSHPARFNTENGKRLS
jgi:hypothetical protein